MHSSMGKKEYCVFERFITLFERESACACEWGYLWRERERIPSKAPAEREPEVGFNPMTSVIMT